MVRIAAIALPGGLIKRVIEAIRWRYPRFIARRHNARGLKRVALYTLAGPAFRGMSAGGAGRLRLLRVVSYLLAAELAGREHGRVQRIVVSYRGERLPVYVDRLNDLDVLYEVFVEKHYDDLELAAPPATILDLGAHIGAALLALHVRFPHARLAAAEADPVTFQRLRRNLAALPEAQAVPAAVGEREGTVDYLASRDGWVSGLAEMAGHFQDVIDANRVRVRSVRLSTLLDEVGMEHADLVKIDIEGAEWPLVNTLDEARVGTVIMEWHADIHDHEPDELVALLPGHDVVAESLPSWRRFVVTARPR